MLRLVRPGQHLATDLRSCMHTCVAMIAHEPSTEAYAIDETCYDADIVVHGESLIISICRQTDYDSSATMTCCNVSDCMLDWDWDWDRDWDCIKLHDGQPETMLA